MSLPQISPLDAHRLLSTGAILVDIRDEDEFRREHIAQAHHMPLVQLQAPVGAKALKALVANLNATCIFHCRSGNRTRLNAAQLKLCATSDAYVLEGGLDAWKRAGLPVVTDRSQPLELARQVQIGAGSMVLCGTLLGAFVGPWFYLIPGAIGAGLIFAGLSGFCGLARLLMRMPWNRRILVTDR